MAEGRELHSLRGSTVIGAFLGIAAKAMVYPRSKTGKASRARVSVSEEGEILIARSPAKSWEHLDEDCKKRIKVEYEAAQTARDAFKAGASGSSSQTLYKTLLTAVDALAQAVADRCECDEEQKNCENEPGQGQGQSACDSGKLRDQIGPLLPGYEAHHLIPCRVVRSAALDKAAKLGYNINGFNNGLALPRNAQVAKDRGLPRHVSHFNEYNICVQSLLSDLDIELENGLSDCELCPRIREIESKLRNSLLSFDIWLTNTDLTVQELKPQWKCPG